MLLLPGAGIIDCAVVGEVPASKAIGEMKIDRDVFNPGNIGGINKVLVDGCYENLGDKCAWVVARGNLSITSGVWGQ